MKITDNFSREEFDCHDGTAYPSKWVDERLHPLCLALEKIRAKIKQPLIITSGYRSPAHNATLTGAAKKSLHTKGMACDFKCKGLGARQLYKVVEEMIKNGEIPNGGLGSYPRHVHYDTGPKGRRWKE